MGIVGSDRALEVPIEKQLSSERGWIAPRERVVRDPSKESHRQESTYFESTYFKT